MLTVIIVLHNQSPRGFCASFLWSHVLLSMVHHCTALLPTWAKVTVASGPCEVWRVGRHDGSDLPGRVSKESSLWSFCTSNLWLLFYKANKHFLKRNYRLMGKGSNGKCTSLLFSAKYQTLSVAIGGSLVWRQAFTGVNTYSQHKRGNLVKM